MSSSSATKRKREEGPVVSYGILLYKRGDDDTATNTSSSSSPPTIQFLLGLIPQRNWWTVFKGLPDDDEGDESPIDTAIREFQEETGSAGLLTRDSWAPVATLHGAVQGKHKKRLEIYLHPGSFFEPTTCFCLERVVKIDSGGGYMHGKPEIVAVQWMTLDQALAGMNGAKIYKSQEGILKQAQDILMRKFAQEDKEKAKGDGKESNYAKAKEEEPNESPSKSDT